MQEITRVEMDAICFTLVRLKEKAMRLGMYKTAHAIEPATQAVGWEMAEILQDKHPTKLKELEEA